MHNTILSQKVRWHSGKGIDLHLGFKNQFSQMTWVVVNGDKLTKHSFHI
jgi:hypothetical protein